MSPIVKLSLFILLQLNVYVGGKKSYYSGREGERKRDRVGERIVLENNNNIIIIILTTTMKIDGVVSEKNRKKKEKGMRRCLINQTRDPVELSGSFFLLLSLTISSHQRCRPNVRENDTILSVLQT